MNYVDRGAFGMDRAATPSERDGPGAARVEENITALVKLKL